MPYKIFEHALIAILIILTYTLTHQSCIKLDDKTTSEPQENPWTIKYDSLGLPELTQEGKGAFGFLLNGKAWKHGCSQGAWLGGWGSLYADAGQIATYNYCDPIDQRLVKGLPNPIKVNDYPVSDSINVNHYPLGFHAYYRDRNSDGQWHSKIYTVGPKSKEKFFFKVEYYDSARKIISGRFQIVLYRATNHSYMYNQHLIDRAPFLDLTDSILISDGRFDLIQAY